MNLHNSMRYDTVVEEYIEIISELLTRKDSARVKDIADSRGVTLPTASSAVERLREIGLVDHEHYGSVTLTRQGEELAAELSEYHSAIKEMLTLVLGVSEKTAEEDACKLEHYISGETVQALLKLLMFLKVCPKGGGEWLKTLHSCSLFCQGSADGCYDCEWNELC